MTSIEIGGGTLVQPGWTNLDSRNGHGEWARLAQDTPWPTGDNTVDAIRASHVMEHIPAGQERIDVMNEAHRVLKPGGVFEIIVPLMVGTWHAIADPTHISFWCKESFHYFDGLFAANADYGIRLWETLELEVVDGWEGHWKGTPR
jgi:ubiquinone/menaquinone biosynthesis C-methylase UbiE